MEYTKHFPENQVLVLKIEAIRSEKWFFVLILIQKQSFDWISYSLQFSLALLSPSSLRDSCVELQGRKGQREEAKAERKTERSERENKELEWDSGK